MYAICYYLVFGLGTLIFNGLEIAMHATMNNRNCVDNIVIAHPILQVLNYFIVFLSVQIYLSTYLHLLAEVSQIFTKCLLEQKKNLYPLEIV